MNKQKKYFIKFTSKKIEVVEVRGKKEKTILNTTNLQGAKKVMKEFQERENKKQARLSTR